MDASPVLKRKGAEALEPWIDGVPVPATKIRRLDEVVPPVELGAGVTPPAAAQSVRVEEVPMAPFEVEEVPMAPASAPNDERAIVVYQPAEAAGNLLRGPLRPEAPLRVNPDWIRSVKSIMLQEASNPRALFDELASRDENPNLAMVPWAPAHAHVAQATTAAASPTPGTEMMDADQDVEGASMEVEQDAAGQPAPAPSFATQEEAFHQQQWPPQHCMAPQQPAPSYQPSPVTWSW